MEVSGNRGTPKSSIVIGFSITNQPFWGSTIYGNHHIYLYVYIYIYIHTGRTCLVSPERYWRACEACTTAGKRAQLLRNVHNISETCTTSLKRAHLECLKTHGGAVKHAIPIYTYHDVYIYMYILKLPSFPFLSLGPVATFRFNQQRSRAARLTRVGRVEESLACGRDKIRWSED